MKFKHYVPVMLGLCLIQPVTLLADNGGIKQTQGSAVSVEIAQNESRFANQPTPLSLQNAAKVKADQSIADNPAYKTRASIQIAGRDNGLVTRFATLSTTLIALVIAILSGFLLLSLRQPPLLGRPVVALLPKSSKAAASVMSLTEQDKPRCILRGLDEFANLMIPLDQEQIRIGRSSGLNDYIIAEDTISRKHLSLRCEQGEWLVEDSNTTNGTMLNGYALIPHRAERLANNDVLQLGQSVRLEFSHA